MPRSLDPRDADATTPGLRRVERAVDRQIREAIEAGELSGLEGEGLPLPRDDDAFVGDRWAATRVMRNAQVLPEWLALRREIEAERERLIRRVRAHLEWLESRRAALRGLPAERILDHARATSESDARFRRELTGLVAAVNARIAKQNAGAPRADFQLAPLTAERLLELAQTPAV